MARKKCGLYAPMLDVRRCHLRPLHDGLHELEGGAKWNSPTHCPWCAGPWDGERGVCRDLGCEARQRERCVVCGLRVGEVTWHGRCSVCERMVCGKCEQITNGEKGCPTCSPATLAEAGSSARPGAAGALPRAQSSPVDEQPAAPSSLKRACLIALGLCLFGCASPVATFRACGEVCTAGVAHVSASWDESRCACFETIPKTRRE